MSWVKLLLGLVSLVRQFTSYLHDKKMMDAGQALEVAKALGEANAAINRAIAVEAAARKKHAANPTDNAFDNEFRRKD